jgi:HrpA-like RNA helicase
MHVCVYICNVCVYVCMSLGRVRAGTCWRLFSREFMEDDRLDEYPLPEIKRVPLEDVCLHVSATATTATATATATAH